MGVQPQDLTKFLAPRPFRPFRLTLTDGRTFEVRDPELIMVGRTSAEIGVRSAEFAFPVYDHVVTISLLHVMQVEVLPESAAG